jgi:hypothetical protein
MAETGRLNDGWRFGVLQTIDFYNSAVKRDGVEGGARVFAHEPPPTGSIEVDAAFAALAAHLADRDGWKPPAWALSTARTTPQPWYVTQLRSQYFVDQANRETPPEFRRRGVFIGANDLARA